MCESGLLCASQRACVSAEYGERGACLLRDMEMDDTFVGSGSSFGERDVLDGHFWEQALQNSGFLDDDSGDGFTGTLDDLLVEGCGLFLNGCNPGDELAQANEEAAGFWAAEAPGQLDSLCNLDDVHDYELHDMEELLVSDTSCTITDVALLGSVVEDLVCEAQTEEGLLPVPAQEGSVRSISDTTSVPKTMTSSKCALEAETCRDRKRSREESLETCESSGPESLLVNRKEVFFGSGGESCGVNDGSKSRSITSKYMKDSTSTPEEEGDPKRQLRLEKNRESASQSRARKKSYVKDLEVKCRMLEAHIAQLQRAVSVTSMENSSLKGELVRVKNPKDGAKSGVAEPAVLESNSLPLEFLPRRSYRCPTGQHCTTAGHFQGWFLAVMQLLLLMVVNTPSGRPSVPQASPLQQLPEERTLSGFSGLSNGCAGSLTGLIWRKKRRRLPKDQCTFDRGYTGENVPLQWRLRKRKRVRSRRRLKCLRTARRL